MSDFERSGEDSSVCSDVLAGKDFTVEQLTVLFHEKADGMTKESAAKFSDHLKTLIDGTDFSPVFKVIAGQKPDKLDQLAHGRFVAEGVGKVLRKCGAVAVYCVKLNFQIEVMHAELAKANSVVELELDQLLLDDVVEPEPSLKIFEMKSLIFCSELKVELRAKYTQLFAERIADGASSQTQNHGRKSSGGAGGEKVSGGVNSVSVSSVSFVSVPKRGSRRAAAKEVVTPSGEESLEEEEEEEDIESSPVNVVRVVPEVWEDSIEFRRFTAELQDRKEVFDAAWYVVYCDEHEKHVKAVQAAELKKRKVAAKKGTLSKESQMQCVLYGLQSAFSRIVAKIKLAVKGYDAIIQCLEGRCTLECTKDVIVDPYNTDNLAGMYQLLCSAYNEPSLDLFNNMLMGLFTHEESVSVCKESPLHPVVSMERLLRSWNQLDLWRFMTKDRLFVVALLRSLPLNSEIRKLAVAHVTEYVNAQQQLLKQCGGNEDEYNRVCAGMTNGKNDMPMFTDLTDWWRDVYVKSIELSQSGNNTGGNTGGNPGNTKGNPQKGATEGGNVGGVYGGGKPYVRHPRGGITETAAQADVLKFVDYKVPFKREVLRSEALHCVNKATGQQHLYTATNEVCIMCVSKDREKKHTNPGCFPFACKKCNMFGHIGADCNQHREWAAGNNKSVNFMATTENSV